MKHEEEIRKLILTVPRPPGEDLPAGVSDRIIEEFSTRIGIVLPSEFCEWLKMTNGPCIGPGGFFGVAPDRSSLDIEKCYALHPKWIERKWLPIAGDGCGNYYLAATGQEYGAGYPVFFIDHEVGYETPAYIVASSIGNFLRFILRTELYATYDCYWPFDRAKVVAEDPQILSYPGLPLPWELEGDK